MWLVGSGDPVGDEQLRSDLGKEAGMEYTTLGQTDLRVSRLALGTWALGGDWGPDIEPGIAAVRRGFDLGVNFFDTAYAYGWGEAEKHLGEALSDILTSRRDELVIATKGGLERTPNGVVRNSDPDFLRQTLTTSLRTLGTDYVDIYFIHWPDPTVSFEETSGVMQGFVDEGLVRYIGLSNFSAEQTARFSQGGRADVAQLPYNLLARDVEKDPLPYLRDHGQGVMAWSALFHGMLTGTLQRGQTFPEGDFRASDPRFQGESFDRLLDALDQLAAYAGARGHSMAQAAIAWIASQGVVPIIGAQHPEHIEASAPAGDLVFRENEIAEMAAITEKSPQIHLEDGASVGVRA